MHNQISFRGKVRHRVSLFNTSGNNLCSKQHKTDGERRKLDNYVLLADTFMSTENQVRALRLLKNATNIRTLEQQLDEKGEGEIGKMRLTLIWQKPLNNGKRIYRFLRERQDDISKRENMFPILEENKTGNELQRNTGARSCSHCYSGTSISITNFEFVFVALGIQNAMGMHHIVICGLPSSTIVFYITSQRARFSKKKKKK